MSNVKTSSGVDVSVVILIIFMNAFCGVKISPPLIWLSRLPPIPLNSTSLMWYGPPLIAAEPNSGPHPHPSGSVPSGPPSARWPPQNSITSQSSALQSSNSMSNVMNPLESPVSPPSATSWVKTIEPGTKWKPLLP